MKKLLIVTVTLLLTSCASEPETPVSEAGPIIHVTGSNPVATAREAKERCPSGYNILGYDNGLGNISSFGTNREQPPTTNTATDMYIRCK